MNNVNIKELAMRVREFVEQAAPLLACVVVEQGKEMELDDKRVPVITILEADKLLDTWIRTSSESLSSIFIGWCIARKINIKALGYTVIAQAAYYALHGSIPACDCESWHGPH